MSTPVSLTSIDNALVAYLKAAESVLGYQWRSCESYTGELDADRLSKIAEQAPAAWVVFGGDQVLRRVGGEKLLKSSWVVIVAAKSKRDEKSSRLGAAGDIGAYLLADDVMQLLDGQTMGLALDGPFLVTGRRQLVSPAKATGYAAVYAVMADCTYRQAPRPPTGLDDFRLVAGTATPPGSPEPGGAAVPWAADPRSPEETAADPIEEDEL